MARVVRNEEERQLDLIFLINLARTMGSDFSGTKAAQMLNNMRRIGLFWNEPGSFEMNPTVPHS